MTVTEEPKRANACASSTPATPPPSTAKRGGIDFADVASRVPQVLTDSMPSIFGKVGFEPLARTTASRASHRSTVPSLAVISTRRSPTNRPYPRRSVIPAFSTHSTWPLSS